MTAPADDPLVSVTELVGRLGDAYTDGDATRAEGAVLDASRLVRAEGRMDWTVDNVPPAVVTVVLNVAARVFRNPDGATSQTDTVGPFSKSRTWSAGSTSLDMGYLTENERKLVRRLAGKTGLHTIRVERDRGIPCDDLYVDSPDSSEPFLFYADRDIEDLHLDPQ